MDELNVSCVVLKFLKSFDKNLAKVFEFKSKATVNDETPDLKTIIEFYEGHHKTGNKLENSSSKAVDKIVNSSSEESDSDEDQVEQKIKNTSKTASDKTDVKANNNVNTKRKDDSSSTSSDSEPNTNLKIDVLSKTTVNKKNKNKLKKVENGNQSDSSSSDAENNTNCVVPKPNMKLSKDILAGKSNKKLNAEHGNLVLNNRNQLCKIMSTDDSSDSDNETVAKTEVLKRKNVNKEFSNFTPKSDEPKVEEPPLKKKKFEKSNAAAKINSNNEKKTFPSKQNNFGFKKMKAFDFPKNNFQKGQRKQGNESFRRVRNEEVQIDDRVKDMSFEAKKNSSGSWGEKANMGLKFTKGKSFKHEKTKMKRGSYRGGMIDTSVNSIKFFD